MKKLLTLSAAVRCRFRLRNAGGGEGLRVLPTGRVFLHALVRLRDFGPVPGHVVRTRRRLHPQSFSRWRRQRLRVRANGSHASPKVTTRPTFGVGDRRSNVPIKLPRGMNATA
jgi:hypothetical protein